MRLSIAASAVLRAATTRAIARPAAARTYRSRQQFAIVPVDAALIGEARLACPTMPNRRNPHQGPARKNQLPRAER
ncbi:MAG: hypothetical protein ABIQ82_02555 [Variovorax sp.]